MFKFCLNKTSTKVKRHTDALNRLVCYLCHKMKALPASILVIEPHPLMREALCLAIETAEGLRVAAQACDGTQALEILPTLPADIILFSLGNPGWDDLQTIAALHRAWSWIPILALTANEVPEQEQAALARGAQAVLTKASTRDEMLCKLRELWENAPMRSSHRMEATG